MPIPAIRTMNIETVRNFGVIDDGGDIELTNLTEIQTKSYDRFLQLDRRARDRRSQGLEEILREVFPIESYDGQYRLEFVKYELGKPRYTPIECRQLRLTYGRPFRVWLRLIKEQPVEEGPHRLEPGQPKAGSFARAAATSASSLATSVTSTALPSDVAW